MTRDDIIKMAKDGGAEVSGFFNYDYGQDMVLFHPAELEKFAALIAAAERERLEATAWGASKKWIDAAVAAEREECAKVCESFNSEPVSHATVAADIRARGEK